MNILVVDDEKMITDALQLILKNSNNKDKITVSTNGEDAFRRMKETTYDIVVIDINMPEINGLTLVKKIRNEINYTPEILMISGNFTPENVQIASDFNIQYTLAKPFNAQKFLEKIETVKKHLSKVKRAS
ncbi:response regulator receiver domain protein [Bacteriovorax sp. BSW11_IV]|uniref:response regulator n=1 Tax=Bacteriovorax sp. BSW11_IV TaxID=1353529 RepID=UPI000389F698|nr:response regulator [Bacteriovorax sp. BSW11_IV]EQC46489.1 response regulator receiver domain protein [Bacteriovorax sp. BSW11_IV]